MRLSTSTNLLFYTRQPRQIIGAEACARLCAQAGYRVLDINCCENADPGCPLTQDDWEQWAPRLRRQADALGVTFSQSHNPIYNVIEPDLTPDYAWQEELTRRSMIAAAILGVRWVVAHAGTALPGGVYDRGETLRRNADYFHALGEKARSLGMEGIALENMAYLGPYSATLPPQLCATTEGLIAQIDACDSEAVGACWDFGHANLGHEDQAESLRRLGKRLKATHVNDNLGAADDHTLPFLGNIAWETILPVLTEIGYAGDLTYEIHKSLRRVPEPLYPVMIRSTVDTGSYLLRLAGGL